MALRALRGQTVLPTTLDSSKQGGKYLDLDLVCVCVCVQKKNGFKQTRDL